MRFGVRREDISLVARDELGDTSREREVGSTEVGEGAGAGALGGSLVGGALGLLIGTGLLVIPGIGPVLAAGPLAAAIGSAAAAVGATALGAGIGAAAGGLLGSLIGAGVSEDEAHAYVEGVRRGGTLVSVAAVDTEADDVRQILARNGAVNIDNRAAEWRAAGWATDARTTGDPDLARGDAFAAQGTRTAGGEPGAYDFRDDEDLGAKDRKVVDSSYTNVDRTGERVKGPEGFETGHTQPVDGDPAQFSEFASADSTSGRRAANRPASDGDTISEATRRTPDAAGADAMGGAGSNMQGGSGPAQGEGFTAALNHPLGSEQLSSMMDGERNAGATAEPARARQGARIYDRSASQGELDTARAGHPEAIPAHGDFARGQREEGATPTEPDFARGMHAERETDLAAMERGDHPDTPPHGDFARGQREEGAEPVQPDYARGQRGYEEYDADFLAHYQSLTGSGGQPYDYYRPGYQFGQDLAHDPAYSHQSWSAAEADARQRWQRDARGSWEEFKQAIRYGWERARGQA
jgi:hypothetical protein